jgi:hypothetical protein
LKKYTKIWLTFFSVLIALASFMIMRTPKRDKNIYRSVSKEQLEHLRTLLSWNDSSGALVVYFDPTCEHCITALKSMVAYKLKGKLDQAYFVSGSDSSASVALLRSMSLIDKTLIFVFDREHILPKYFNIVRTPTCFLYSPNRFQMTIGSIDDLISNENTQ